MDADVENNQTQLSEEEIKVLADFLSVFIEIEQDLLKSKTMPDEL